jgi:hypothetical protein
LLQELQHVTTVNPLSPVSYSMVSSNPDELRREVMRWALKHNVNIAGMQAQTHSLEDVFRSLTTKAG